ncbi:MAG: hypothetical protein EXS22_11060 [Pedosphaera sp.]|nr:hypothetical protein [Pedosphaera sp.]MSU44552.1 hypothetical protein [Pedosphaera sp.]
MNFARHILLCSVAAALLAFTGCAGYQMGRSSGKTVQVKFFENQTLEPRLLADINRALRQQLQQDGTYRLVSTGGDVVVSGVLKRYTRNGVSYTPTDVLAVQDYQLVLTAQVKVTEAGTGKVLLDREVTGDTTLRVGTDLSSGERQASPLIAETLAGRALSLITNGDWPVSPTPAPAVPAAPKKD